MIYSYKTTIIPIMLLAFALPCSPLHAGSHEGHQMKADAGGAGTGQAPAFATMPGTGKKVPIGNGAYLIYGFDEKPKMGMVIMKVAVDGNSYKFAAGGAEPDVAYIRDFIDDLNFVKADKFIDNPDPVLAEKFSNPEILVRLTIDGKPDLNLSFLSSADKMYARIGPGPSLIELPAEFSKNILKTNNDFRNRRIVPSAFMSTLSAVTIDGVLYKKITGSWFTGDEIAKAEGPDGPTKAKESPHVRPFVVDLEFAKTEDFYQADQPDFLE